MSPGPHDSHESGYHNTHWMGLGDYAPPEQQQSGHGHNEFSGYGYPAAAPPLPMEPSYTMSRPPPYASAPQSHMPPPLIMPQHHHVWPSMLANTTGTYQTPILPAATIHTPISATSIGSDLTPLSAKSSTSRRKLTDDERRLMCLEAENNPTMKQTQIGAKFNVERSTVSKILRQKDKYMKQTPKDEVTSPGKKVKSKIGDIEKTLMNWARNQQQKTGRAVTNADLRKQVLMFSAGRHEQATLYNDTWVERFKSRYLSSEADSSHESAAESSTTQSETMDNSPMSSDGMVSPDLTASDLPSRSFKPDRPDNLFEFEASPSLPHGFSTASPSPRVGFSPLSPDFSRMQTDLWPMNEITPTEATFPRQRSVTLPQLAPIEVARPIVITPLSRAVTSIQPSTPRDVDPRQTMKRHKSVPDIHEAEADSVRYSSMQPPPLPRSADISPVGGPASTSSSPEETIRALHQIQKMLESRPDVAEPDDYVMIGKLMEKLKLLRSPSLSSTPILPGGMMALENANSPRTSKKRTLEMSIRP